MNPRLTLLVATALAAAPCALGQVEMLANGDFETGDFTGWSVGAGGAGAWMVNDGTRDPYGPAAPLAPIRGNFDLVSEQTGPALCLLSQGFVVPPTVVSATLAWTDRIQNFATGFRSPDQEFRVVVRDGAGTLLHTVFATGPGEPLMQPGPNRREFDLTTLLQGLPLQTVILGFEEQDNQYFLNVSIDDVSLLVLGPNRQAHYREFGQGCPPPAPAMIHELFDPWSPARMLDLGNLAVTFAPNGMGGYLITRSGTLEANLTNSVPCGDEQVLGPFPLPFSFPYEGGASSTCEIEVSSNGYLLLRPGTLGPRCCYGDPGAFAVDPESIAVLGTDLDPASGGAIYVDRFTNPNRVVVTWSGVPEAGTSSANTAQCQLFESGQIVLAYGSVAVGQHSTLVGYSPGHGAAAISIDLTADLPRYYFAGVFPLMHHSLGDRRPLLGQGFDLEIANIPSMAPVGFLMLGLVRSNIDLTGMGMPSCSLYARADSLQAFAPVGHRQVMAFALPNSQRLLGVQVFSQAALLLPRANAFGFVTSNGCDLGLGDY